MINIDLLKKTIISQQLPTVNNSIFVRTDFWIKKIINGLFDAWFVYFYLKINSKDVIRFSFTEETFFRETPIKKIMLAMVNQAY